MNGLIYELNRRNVFRMAILYIVSSWLILQMGDVLFDLLGLPDWTLRIAFGLLLLGFPIALIFSWLYELTPEGLKREQDVDRNQSITAQTGKKLNALTLVVASVAIALMIYEQAMGPERALPSRQSQTVSPPTAAEQPSIAVLPFRDMSATGDQAYFGEGIAEELLNALAQVGGLRVASRTSSFSFEDKADLQTIAERLEVSHLLEGSIRTAGDKIRVTAQLIDVRNDAHLWSQTFDRRLGDIFAIQDDITTRVVEQLKPHFDTARLAAGTLVRPVERVSPRRMTDNAEAYRLFLKGRHEWRQRPEVPLAEATASLSRAVSLDPNFREAATLLEQARGEQCRVEPDQAVCSAAPAG